MVFYCHLEAMDSVPASEPPRPSKPPGDVSTASESTLLRASHDLPPLSHDQEGEGPPPPATTVKELSRTHTLVMSSLSRAPYHPRHHRKGRGPEHHQVSYEPDDVPMAAFTQVSPIEVS